MRLKFYLDGLFFDLQWGMLQVCFYPKPWMWACEWGRPHDGLPCWYVWFGPIFISWD